MRRVLLIAVAAALGCRLPVQSFSYYDTADSVTPPVCVDATVRDEFERWMVEKVKEIRDLLENGADESDPEVDAIAAELQRSAVDWKTFLAKTNDSFKFPMMAYANHSWFQWRQVADLHRDIQVVTGNRPEASNLWADGEVPSSAFFTRSNIASYTPERLKAEFAEFAPVGKITITREKSDGTSEGFFGKDERGIEYIFIFDPPFNPEMQTAAEHIGSTLVRIMGWHIPKTVVCTVTGTGNHQYDGRRATATIAVNKYSGGWTYRTYRNRREVRALTTVGAWLNNVDQTEHNTGISQPAEGVFVYYVWDYGCSLGSFTFRPKWPRLGWQYLVDPLRYCTAHLGGTPWQRNWRVQSAAVGYLDDCFDPEQWVPFYPNIGLEEATRADKCWAAARIAQITDDQIRCIVESADYSYPSDCEYVIKTLMARRHRIVQCYLGLGETLLSNSE